MQDYYTLINAQSYMKPEVLLRGVMEAKLFRYLSKPVRMSEMVTVIQAAIAAHDAAVAAP